jgi:hypothetical protein
MDARIFKEESTLDPQVPPAASATVTLEIKAHPYLFSAMFELSSDKPSWLGPGWVNVSSVTGGVNESGAIVRADAAGQAALLRAGFLIRTAADGRDRV